MEILQNNIELIIILFLSGIGVGVIVYNLLLLSKEQKIKLWNVTQGIITKSELGVSQSLTQESYDNHYRANIEYEYQIKGNKYISCQAYIGDNIYLSHKDKAEKILKLFPINKLVNVYYNPDINSESVLIKGTGLNRFLNIGIGLAIIIASALIERNYELILEIINGL